MQLISYYYYYLFYLKHHLQLHLNLQECIFSFINLMLFLLHYLFHNSQILGLMANFLTHFSHHRL